MNDFYVYAWLRPNGLPFYIGKGRRRRDLTPKDMNPLFDRIVAKIRKDGLEPDVVRIHEGLVERDAFSLEKELIQRYGRRNNGTGILANMTDGGEGRSGAVVSEETLAKMSRAMQGRSLTAEHRQKLRIASLGKVISLEQREKLRQANLGKKQTAEVRAKIGAAHLGRKASAETIAKRVAALRGKKRDDEARARMSGAQHKSGPRMGLKGVFPDEGKWRARISVSGERRSLGRFKTPEEAARAYDMAAYEAWGLECYLNFPELIARDEAA